MDKQSILKELRRELAMRESVYPDWVQRGKLSQRTATHRVAAIEAAIALIEAMPDEEADRTQLDLFGGAA